MSPPKERSCEYCGTLLADRHEVCSCGVVDDRPWHRVKLKTMLVWTAQLAIFFSYARAFDFQVNFPLWAVVLWLVMMLTRTFMESPKRP
jgi:isocitrate dehydrogenase kinase/phosphatase